jgi:hypothetical protein
MPVSNRSRARRLRPEAPFTLRGDRGASAEAQRRMSQSVGPCAYFGSCLAARRPLRFRPSLHMTRSGSLTNATEGAKAPAAFDQAGQSARARARLTRFNALSGADRCSVEPLSGRTGPNKELVL